MSFLRWRLRNKVGLFGSLWYLAMAIVLFVLSKPAPEIRYFCLFFGGWSLLASIGWFFLF